AKTLQHRVGRDPVAKIDDMIDHSGEPWLRRIDQLRVCGVQCHRAFRLKPNAIVHSVKPNQGLTPPVRTIFAGMNLDHFVRFVFSRQSQGVLNVVAWKNMRSEERRVGKEWRYVL